MVADVLTNLNRKRVFDYAGQHRIPALYEYDFFVRDRGLMSYGPDLKECVSRAAALVARIFNGGRPADLQFEEPTNYLLVISLKAARATGIQLPPVCGSGRRGDRIGCPTSGNDPLQT
jgi:ABC-type uncharacterized transport system substrate-binding protein